MSSQHDQTVVYVIFLLVIIFFVVMGSWMEAKKFMFGHETTVIILVGMLVSWLVTRLNHEDGEALVFQFNAGIFFDFMLPCILFAAGYNMRRREFFKNFTNIIKFGIFGSLFTFAFYVLLTKLLFVSVEMTMYDPKLKDFVPFELSWIEIMLVCSILVSSDIIAAMSILNFNEAPHIFSIILGEGLFNDVVVIVLYQTVKSYQEDPELEFTSTTIFEIIGSFCTMCMYSVAIGVIMGFLITYVLKRFRSITHSAIHESFLLICCAMLTYYLSEIAGQSGIASLVTCALVEAHYTWYNLSPQGKHVTSVAFQTFGYGAESFVFSFIGLSLMFYTDYPYSWQFICAEFFIIIIGRFAAIVLSYYMFECFKGDPSNKLSFREITFLSYAAFIRGCIAFGLVENLDGDKFKNKRVIVSSVLCLVISSTCIIGSFTALFKNWVMPSPEAKGGKSLKHSSINRLSPTSSNEFEFEEEKDKKD